MTWIDIDYEAASGAEMSSVFLQENVLLFVLDGQVSFWHGANTCTLSAQQFVFFRKGILLDYRFKEKCSSFLLFMFKPELALQFAGMAKESVISRESPEPMIMSNPDRQLLAYFNSLMPYFHEAGAFPDVLINIKLLELLFCLSANYPSVVEQIVDGRERFLSDITNIVEGNLTDSLSLPKLARLAGRSLSSFRRDFLAIYNMPPSKWIRQKKLEKARQLLMNTNMTITDICYTMGFQSVAHFSRIFKSCFGYCPSDLRVLSLPAV
jgi:AraC-like DNA-binding protein